jgi:hypothetical protein
MNILFTLLCIDQSDDNCYIDYCNEFLKDLLKSTDHDVLISTNQPEKIIKSERVTARNNLTNDLMIFKDIPEHEERLLMINGKRKFNCTLKFLCFENIPNINQYDIIVYVDCDCAIEWTHEDKKFIFETFMENGFDMIGTRMGDTLGQEWDREDSIYNHKKEVYGKIENPENAYDVGLPSEHFFMLKNDPEKINKFAKELRRLNYILQDSVCVPWGESYELGISLYKAGFIKPKNVMSSESIGIIYNHYNTPYKKIVNFEWTR